MHTIMSKQLHQRIALPLLRHVLETFNAGAMTSEQACSELGLSRSRLFAIRKEWLSAIRRGEEWVPSGSGGAHKAPWTEELKSFLRQALSTRPPASFAFAASEAVRLGLAARLDRAQVRLWAISQGLSRPKPKDRASCHTRRWQRLNVGELWQLDATPDRFLGRGRPSCQLLDMLDDCSRVQVGCRLYLRECVRSYLDLFYRAFSRYGLPLEVHVDKAGFFRGEDGGLTQLGKRLKFYDVSFVFANAPESKGKVERIHLVWQDRLPAYFEREGIDIDTPLAAINDHVDALVDYRNGFEIHREIGMTPDEAWGRAIQEGRSKLRAIPQDGWRELVWSEWSRTVVGRRGRVSLADGRFCPTECANGTKAWLCRHVDDTLSIVLNKPEHGVRPSILFSNNPRVRKT